MGTAESVLLIWQFLAVNARKIGVNPLSTADKLLNPKAKALMKHFVLFLTTECIEFIIFCYIHENNAS